MSFVEIYVIAKYHNVEVILNFLKNLYVLAMWQIIFLIHAIMASISLKMRNYMLEAGFVLK